MTVNNPQKTLDITHQTFDTYGKADNSFREKNPALLLIITCKKRIIGFALTLYDPYMTPMRPLYNMTPYATPI